MYYDGVHIGVCANPLPSRTAEHVALHMLIKWRPLQRLLPKPCFYADRTLSDVMTDALLTFNLLPSW